VRYLLIGKLSDNKEKKPNASQNVLFRAFQHIIYIIHKKLFFGGLFRLPIYTGFSQKGFKSLKKFFFDFWVYFKLFGYICAFNS